MGQTLTHIRYLRLSTVYPHLRGADLCVRTRRSSASGVSPPAWGRHILLASRLPSQGCIPTCVGQTYAADLNRELIKVYPHLRGADSGCLRQHSHHPGVSPPAWGRLELMCAANNIRGCIPTCVGQTSESISKCRVSSVYPHLRGADKGKVALSGYGDGVSPPAWGRLHHPQVCHAITRCIPTCVGQTSQLQVPACAMTVYPHLRGADLRRHLGIEAGSGVSPPAWGRHIIRCLELYSERCIPTCVGQTLAGVTPAVSEAVYPHLRGADSPCICQLAFAGGVSPPAWGRRNCILFD